MLNLFIKLANDLDGRGLYSEADDLDSIIIRLASSNASDDDHVKQVALMKFLSRVARSYDVAEHVYIGGGDVRDFILGFCDIYVQSMKGISFNIFLSSIRLHLVISLIL